MSDRNLLVTIIQ